MATKRILLSRLWDGHPAGEIVEEQDFTVDSMVRKGYGTIMTAKDIREREKAEAKTKADAEREAQEKAEAEAKAKTAKNKGPRVETTMLTPNAETADVTPQTGGE